VPEDRTLSPNECRPPASISQAPTAQSSAEAAVRWTGRHCSQKKCVAHRITASAGKGARRRG
jgi:hypothetical protein